MAGLWPCELSLYEQYSKKKIRCVQPHFGLATAYASNPSLSSLLLYLTTRHKAARFLLLLDW